MVQELIDLRQSIVEGRYQDALEFDQDFCLAKPNYLVL